MFETMRLDNGIPVIVHQMPDSPSVTIGFYIQAGTVDEANYPKGISHMIEHMLFKGTASRSARDIAKTIDLVGGEINAYTSKECTGIYAKVLPSDLDIPIEVISDMLMRSLYDRDEMEKEKSVIIEEIRAYEDTPEELNYDLLSEVMYADTSLVNPILGYEDSVQSINREQVLDYLRDHYTTDRMAIAIAGAFDPESTLAALNRTIGALAATHSPFARPGAPFGLKSGVAYRHMAFEQTHLDLAFWGPSANDPLYYAMHLINIVMGATMSSRLFQKVREEHGLVYSIYSSLSNYERTGNTTISLSLSEKNVKKAVRAVIHELVDLRNNGLTTAEVEEAKHHLKGNLVLSMETSDAYMGMMAKDFLFERPVRDIASIVDEIDAVTMSQIDEALQRIFSGEKALSAVGKVEKKIIMDMYDEMINHLEG